MTSVGCASVSLRMSINIFSSGGALDTSLWCMFLTKSGTWRRHRESWRAARTATSPASSEKCFPSHHAVMASKAEAAQQTRSEEPHNSRGDPVLATGCLPHLGGKQFSPQKNPGWVQKPLPCFECVWCQCWPCGQCDVRVCILLLLQAMLLGLSLLPLRSVPKDMEKNG